MQETHARSIVKALTWKVLAAILAFALSLFVTGELAASLNIAGGMFAIGLIFFYLHERAWNYIRWGRSPN